VSFGLHSCQVITVACLARPAPVSWRCVCIIIINTLRTGILSAPETFDIAAKKIERHETYSRLGKLRWCVIESDVVGRELRLKTLRIFSHDNLELTMTDFWTQTNWYAIHTKRLREDQAASNISRLEVKVFLPKVKHEKLEFGHRREILKPLFPGYLFACFCPSHYLYSIRYARGVRRVISAGEQPIPLENEIISTIQSRIGKDGFVTLSAPTSSLSNGQEVVINSGPLQGLVGIFDSGLSDSERAAILLRTVEYQVRVLVKKSCVSPATEVN
jgi:transcriptional antiterminator RfaH